MKKITTILIAVLTLTAPLITQAKPNPSLKFSECFLKYNTMNGETEIILYNIRFTKKTAMSEKRFKEMFELTEFEIKELGYDSMERPTSIRVLAQTKNFMRNTPVQQLFSNMLGEKAEVSLGGNGPMGMKMSVMFPKQKNMYIADNNANQLLESEEKKLIVLEFDLSDFPSKPLEAVIGWKEKESLTVADNTVVATEYRPFTNHTGKTIVAKVIAVDTDSGKVQLELKNRKKAWVEISTLSSEDQAYVKQWKQKISGS